VSTTETGQMTGTKDKDYNLIWFTEACLSNALRMETYIQDAERDGDSELAELFKKAQSRKPQGRRKGQAIAPPAACWLTLLAWATRLRSAPRKHRSATGRVADSQPIERS
jgi:hypothetical protein